MYLKKIEINGFKSFANRTELVLSGGITGVVGPNGSGKSNIADAIRWVLGEQSSKNLRGTKMEDVIFNGTQNRAKKAYCEVALVFDNEDMRLPCDYSEVSLSRKMYRSGESEYYLNGQTVRLKDVLDLIRDTGIGKEGYSIVGQGRIDEILSSKPVARRKVFEEAAGIMKFRVRKEEAERKLERTDENLMRVEDILEELKDQMGPLEVQAAQTREYLALFERQKILDANLYLANYERLGKRIQKLKEEFEQIESDIAAEQRQFGEDSEQTDTLSAQLSELEREADELSKLQAQAREEIERFSGEEKLILERMSTIDRDIARFEEEEQARDSQTQESAQRADELRQKEDLLVEEARQVQESIGLLENRRQEINARLDERRRRKQELSDRHITLMRQLAEKKSELASLCAQKDNLNTQNTGVKEQLAVMSERLQQLQEHMAGHSKILCEMQERKTKLARERNENSAQTVKYKQDRDLLRERIAAARQAEQNAVAGKRMLENLKADYEGYSNSVRNLMREAKGAAKIQERMKGTLADLIQVPEQYETAISAALGGALQNVVVQDGQDARQIIEFLRDKRLGRVTFLPLDELHVKELTEGEQQHLDEGYLAVAADVVRCEEKVQPAVRFLLGRTILVDTMQHAIAMMRSAGYAFRAVTLEGDMVNPGGVMTGGSLGKRETSLLARDREISELAQEAQRNAKQVKQLEEELASCENNIALSQKKAEELFALLREQEVLVAAEREKTLGQEQKRDQWLAEQQDLEGRLAYFADEQISLNAEIDATRRQTQDLEDEAAETLEEVGKIAEDSQQELQETDAKLSEFRILRAEQMKEREAIQSELERIQEEIKKAKLAVASKKEAVSDLVKQKADANIALEGAQSAAQNSRIRLDDAREMMRENEEGRQALKGEISSRQKHSMEYQMRQASLLERKYKVEGQVEKFSLALETAGNKLWEDYEMTYGEAEKLREAIGYTECSRELQEIRGKIRELGSINPNAIEDFERIRLRVEELETQRGDLLKAEEDLRKVIEELIGAMRINFSEKFVQINDHFKRIFSELFGGGRCELLLEEGDIMECGIEIKAEPPGKKLQHISLLSGGERALTAIALLFAMITINPSPICLLDEIDAPLDDLNVARFGEYLKNLASSQFVVISHKKATMAVCNTLYGVAMEEKGISKLLSVKMDQ